MKTFKGFLALFSRVANAPTRTIGGAALVIAVAGIASRLLGFVRDRLLASSFGAGDTLDAYYAAFRIPDLLYNLLVMGALSAAFVPVFTGLLESKREKDAWRLAAGITQWLVIGMGIVSFAAFVLVSPLIALVAPGFSGEKRALTEVLTRIMLLSPILLSVSAVLGGVLVSFRRFVAYSLAPVLYNLGIIGGIVFLVPTIGTIGLAWGVVAGALLHVIVQIPAVRISGFRGRLLFRRPVLDPAIRRVVRLMIPRSLGMGMNQAGLLITTVFASGLASGSLAVFSLAYNIQSIPLGLFGVAFSLAAFPALSLAAARKADREFFETIASTARRILFFVMPVSALLIIFRAQFVRVILGTGQFDWEDTIATFGVLAWFSVSLFAQSLVPLLARGFFALQDTRTPLLVALGSEVVHIALIPVLIPEYGVTSLAMAFSAGSLVNLVLLYQFLRRRVSSWDERRLLVGAGKIMLATLFAGTVAQLSKSAFILAPSPLDTFAEVFLQLLFGSVVGFGAFLAASVWLRIEELGALRRFVLVKVFRQPEAAASMEGHPEKGEW